MPQATILCYKTTDKTDLKRVANYFQMTIPMANSEVVVFHSNHLESVLKVEASRKAAFYFKFGCVCLVNFEATEVYRFISMIESTGEVVDYRRFFSHVEREEVMLGDGTSNENFFKTIAIHATALAKSVELKHLENSVSLIFDKAERILNDLQSGFPNPSSQLLMETTFGIVRSQLGVIKNLRILDRPRVFGDSLELRVKYDAASKEHSLDKRFAAIQLKLNDLMTFISPYRKLGYSQKERRLLLIEVVLIALFPLAHFVRDLIHF